ncbi:MAG: hypothetical protein K5876_00955 [Ruminiclostridium sp.]|nr:hypothetical protein [Ruminiclostridium sp.]
MEYKNAIEEALTGLRGSHKFCVNAEFAAAVKERAKSESINEERKNVRNIKASGKPERKEHRIMKTAAWIAGAAAVIAGAFFGLKYLRDNNITLLKEGGVQPSASSSASDTASVNGTSAVSDTEAPEVTSTAETRKEPVWYTAGPGISVQTPDSIDFESMTEEETLIWMLMKGMRWGMNEREIQLVMQGYWGIDKYERYEIPAADDHVTEQSIFSYDGVYFYGESSELVITVQDTQGLTAMQHQVRYEETEEGAWHADDLFDRVTSELTAVLGEPEPSDPEKWYSSDGKMSLSVIMPDEHTVVLRLDDLTDRADGGDIETTADTTTAPIIETTAETTVPADPEPTDDELKALVEQGAGACGLRVTISDLCRASLKLHYTRDKSVKYADKLDYEMSNRYEIQFLNAAGEWQTYDPETLERWNDGYHWFDLMVMITDDIPEFTEPVPFYGDDADIPDGTEIPDGHYRVVKSGGVSSEITGNVLGRITVYAEFDITKDTPNLLGLTFTAKNVTRSHVTVVAEHEKEKFFGSQLRLLGYTAPYNIQRFDNGAWKPYSAYETDGILRPIPSWDSKIYPVNIDGTTEIDIDFETLYGELPDGRYRVGKTFLNYTGKAGETDYNTVTVLNEITCYTEFTVGGEVDPYGISLEVKDVDDDSLTLVIKQSGGEYSGTLAYYPDYYIEKQNKRGEWERVEMNPITWAPEYEPVNIGGTTEVMVRYARDYGKLPKGRYRITKRFADMKNEGEKYSYHGYSAEFDITDGETRWGVTMTAGHVTSTEMELHIYESGGVYAGDIIYGSDYAVERLENGEWVRLPYIHDNVAFTALGYILRPGTGTELRHNWSYMYGALPAGKYRLSKGFNDEGYKYPAGEKTFYVEFELTEETGSRLGVTMRRMNNTAGGIELEIEQHGGTAEGDIVYDPSFVVERDNNGVWEELPTLSGYPPVWNGYESVLPRSEVTKVNLSWGEFIYGTLSEGKYRVRKDFRCGKIKETAYAEFTVTMNMLNSYGIGLKVGSVTRTGLDLEISRTGGEFDGTLYRLGYFRLLRQTADGKSMKAVGELPDESGKERIKMHRDIAEGFTLDWSDVLGGLKPGVYELEVFFCAEDGSTNDEISLNGEFSLTVRFEIK